LLKKLINKFKNIFNKKEKEFDYVENKISKYHDLFHNFGEYPLNKRQQKAVVKNEKYNQVIAAAGTGKTTVLAYRIKYLIEEGVKPDRILAITFSNKAAEEMEIRLKEKFNITEVNVSTIHSFANNIIKEENENKLSTIESHEWENIIEEAFDDLMEYNTKFRKNYYLFLSHNESENINEEEFENKTEFVAKKREKNYETFKSEEVKSQAEKFIADLLFINNIDYQYEKIADWADKSKDKIVYQPDFYLPEYDIYIEHWGIDRDNEVPDWFEWSSEKYLAKLEWAKNQFEKHNKILVESFDYDYQENNLESILKSKLKKKGVEFEQETFKDFVDSVVDVNTKNIIDDYKNFIEEAKKNNLSVNEIKNNMDNLSNREYYFTLSAMDIYKYVINFLNENRKIDFNDMIYKATDILEEKKKYTDRYDHLLVDEFQDVSFAHISIIKKFFKMDSDIKLFCVGDDWQSIYSFQGSDPKYFIDFEKYFAKAAKTYLVDNYRCPKKILDAGNDLIANNSNQIEKKVIANNDYEMTPKLHILRKNNYTKSQSLYVLNLIQEYLAKGNEPKDIMIISRFDGYSDQVSEIKKKFKEKDIPYKGKQANDFHNSKNSKSPAENSIYIFSVHQSKGREADYIILLHMVEKDKTSFPAPKRENKLLKAVKLNNIDHIEEERRLFYVAITRTSKKLDIITQKNNISPFVEEIDNHLVKEKKYALKDIEDNSIDLTVKLHQLWDASNKKIRQIGLLKDSSNKIIKFISWEKCKLSILEKNIWYKLRNIKIKKYNDKKEIHFTNNTEIVKLYNA